MLAQTSNIQEQAYNVHIKKNDVPDASQIKIFVGVQKKNNKNNCMEASKAKTVGASVFEYVFGEKYNKYFLPFDDSKNECARGNWSSRIKLER